MAKLAGFLNQLDGVAISGTKLGRAYTWQGVQRHIQALDQCQNSLKVDGSWEKEIQQSRDLYSIACSLKTEPPKNQLLKHLKQASTQEANARQREGQVLNTQQQALTQLHTWQKAARALRQSKDYQRQINAIVTSFQAGQPLSPKAVIAIRQDLSAYEQGINSLQSWQQAAKEMAYSEEQCQRIAKLTSLYKEGQPLPELAMILMREDLSHFKQQSQLYTQRLLEEDRQERRLENKLSPNCKQGDEYER